MEINGRSGVGRSTAIALSHRGATVALLARSTDVLKELAQKLPGSLPLTVDMAQFDRVREAIGAVHKHYGRINGLVNNAGRRRAPAQQACVLSARSAFPCRVDPYIRIDLLVPCQEVFCAVSEMGLDGAEFEVH